MSNIGSSALTSDHVVNADDNLMCHIAFLFTLFVVHGSVPDGFLSSTIIPIPKSHNTNMSDGIFEVSLLVHCSVKYFIILF